MTLSASSLTPMPSVHHLAVRSACAIIAPTFPLDRFIAVNPYWGFVSTRIDRAAHRLRQLSGTSLLMKRSWFRERWQSGDLTHAHLQMALERSGRGESVDDVLHLLRRDEKDQQRTVLLMTHLADEGRDVGHHGSWASFVTHTVSQLCASHFDAGQAAWSPRRDVGLYRAWRGFASADRSPALLMSCDVRRLASQLPESPHELIEEALRELQVPTNRVTSYLGALLLDVSGWAAWCAYRRFQARLVGNEDEAIEELVGVRLAWELLLLRSGGGGTREYLVREWQAARLLLPDEDAPLPVSDERALEWVWQHALEISFQETLIGSLKGAVSTPEVEPPSAQVVFCIDVRSEPFRRALEAAGHRIRTLGFAGFFGLPIEYAPLGTQLVQPQLPGLLAARLRVTDVAASERATETLRERRQARLGIGQSLLGFQRAATSGFAFVEALGLTYAWKLVQGTLGLSAPSPSEQVALDDHERGQLRPRLVSTAAGAPLDLTTRVDLVHNILKAASLTRGFARLVVFAGHASATSNNPHAAGLDCGACSGQSGAVNARVLAALLNDRQVREGLKERGVVIPDTTHFLGGMHNTTTDELPLYDVTDLPDSHRGDVDQLKRALSQAGNLTRAERAPALGLAGDDPSLLQAIRTRSRDWSEVRPEWGLVNNAAFIVAPRDRTAKLRLGGRVFLHDYRYQDDEGFSVLELIMTAPMIVTHWINMQYYASTVDNQRYGSGNKVLHNVVGGHLGVFEGNGGDLRIGLPMQSVHDGRQFRHTPLRLSVFIAAPREAIDGVIERHALVRQLVENEWLHMFRLDDHGVEQRRGHEWSSS